MPASLLRVVLVGALLSVGIAEEAGEVRVIALTEQNFDAVVSSNRVVLVEFLTSWCEPCRPLLVAMKEAAERVSSSGDAASVVVATLDMEAELGLAERFSVTSYPMMRVFFRGFPHDLSVKNLSTEGITESLQVMADPNWSPPPSDVLSLTRANFAEVINNADLIVVNFYTPDCYQCDISAPDFEDTAHDFKQDAVQFAKVDGQAEEELVERYNITSFPTLRLFRRGKDYAYRGPMDRTGMGLHLRQEMFPPSEELLTKKEFKHFMKQQYRPYIIAFPRADNSFFSLFMDLANVGRNSSLQFAHSFNAQLASKHGLKQDTLAVFRPKLIQSKFEPAVEEYQGDLSNVREAVEELVWISKPLVSIRTQKSQRWFQYPFIVVYTITDGHEGRGDYTYWRNALLPLAREHRGQLSFLIAQESDYHSELAVLGMEDWGEDVMSVLWASPTTRYRYKGEFNAGGLTRFIEEFFAGNLEPYVHSKPVPKQSGPLLRVVGSTFRQVVLDSDKNVVVLMFAERCPKCDEMLDLFKVLASKHSADEGLVFSVFDARSNDAPDEFIVTKFPTVFLVAAGEDMPLKYDGGIDIELLEQFVRDNVVIRSDRDEL